MRVSGVTAAAALATCIGGAGCRHARAPAVQRPDILLVTIDTLRADRLGAGIAPTLDRLAASAVRFVNARAAAPLTLPSHATIMTGLLPPAHGVRTNGGDALGASHPTIARLLKDRGYRTAAFVGAFVLDRRFGLAHGFEHYDDRIRRDPTATERLEAERPASAVVDSALEWLNGDDPDSHAEGRGPLFMWIHLYDPHAPYNPPPQFVRSRSAQPRGEDGEEGSKDRYDGEIAYADSQIARVFDWFRSHALDRALVIVAGDHGEGLGDHGERTHGMLLYDSTLRVPLFIAAPDRGSETRSDPVSLADIAPTILHAAGVAPPGDMKGRDLLGPKGRDGGTIDVYSETEYPRAAGWSPLQALTDGRWMVIRAPGSTELYDLRADPREEHDAAAAQPATATAFAARIEAIRAGASEPTTGATVSAEAQERLRALGYVAASRPGSPPGSPSASSIAPNPATRIAWWNEFEEALSTLDARRPEAVALLARLAAANPDSALFQMMSARALSNAGRPRAALPIYRAAVRRWPTDTTLLHDLAVAAREAGYLNEARQADEAAVAVAPTNASAHNGIGLIAADQSRPEDAVRHFERAAELDPNNAGYWANLGNAKRAIADPAGAEQAYRRALAVESRNVEAANGLGVLLVEARRAAEAVPWFERAIAVAPDFVEARLNLGIALQESGQRERAADMYRAVLNASGSHPRQKSAAARLLDSLGAAR